MNKLVLNPNQLVKLQDRCNMNKLRFIIAILIAVVSCTSQVEQVGTPFVAGQEVTLSATMPSGQELIICLANNAYQAKIPILQIPHKVKLPSLGMRVIKCS